MVSLGPAPAMAKVFHRRGGWWMAHRPGHHGARPEEEAFLARFLLL